MAMLAYSKDFRNSRYPVVNTGNLAHPTYFPAEVCEVLPGQAYRSQLGGTQPTWMIEFACRKPVQNAHSIVDQGLAAVGLVSPNNAFLVRPQICHGYP